MALTFAAARSSRMAAATGLGRLGDSSAPAMGVGLAARAALPARGASAGLAALLAVGVTEGRRRVRRSVRPLCGVVAPSPRFARASASAAGAPPSVELPKAKPEGVPVVLLSGFLGTGKTTLLKHWLENAEGRIGVVVNDVAAVNIDAKLVDSQKVGADGAIDTIQLQNGCACCSLGDELLVTIWELLRLGTEDRPFSQIVVELSGVAEPDRVKENFSSAVSMGSEVVEGMFLDKVVTLVDTSTFCTNYMEYKKMLDRPDLHEDDSGGSYEVMEAKVVELLCEQVESADVVVLNKGDLASEEQKEATGVVVRALNEKASVKQTSFGKVALSDVLDSPSPSKAGSSASEHEGDGHAGHGHKDHSSASESHGHSHSSESHGHSHGHSHGGVECTDESHRHSHSHSHGGPTTAEERFGITSFCYSARRPFDAERLAEALQSWPVPKQDDIAEILSSAALDKSSSSDESPLARVIRSKGFAWLCTHPSSKMYWSHAGKTMALEYQGIWWGALSEEQRKMLSRHSPVDYDRARREDWDDEWADRRQEIVFIGHFLDEAGVRAVLDGCLLTDEEMKEYLERQAEDEQALASEMGYVQ